MARLSLRERRLAYRIGRDAWLESGKDPERAKQIAEDRLKANTALPPIVIEIMVRIIVSLIIEWMKNRAEDPPEESVLLRETPFDSIEQEEESDGF